jgi:outer membrane protein TolC
MKPVQVPILLLCLRIAGAAAATPAPSFTLGEAVDTALSSSPAVLRATSVAEETSWRKVEAYSGFLPTVTLGATHLFAKRYALTDISFGGGPISVPQIIPTSSFTLNASLPLFDGLSSTNRLRSARAFERSAEAESDWARFRIEREVTLQFYRALTAELLRDVAEQNLRTIEDHYKDTQLFKRAGVSTNYDVLRVDVQRSEAKSELLNAEDNVALERKKLAEAIGAEQDLPAVKGALPAIPENLLQGFEAKDFSNRTDIRALEERQSGFDRAEAAASTYWVPRVSLFYQYQWYNNLTDRFSDWDRYRDAYQFGVQASWGLIDGLASFARSKESVEQRVQADLALRTARIHADQDLDFWRRKFGYYTAVYHARVDDIEKSTESVRLAREGRRAGARTNTELLDAELELFRARATAVNAQMGAIESVIRLELASGKKLYSFR